MSETPEIVRSSIRNRFTRTAQAPQEERKFPVGPENAKRLGYAAAEIDAFPSSVTESFCGVGDPFVLGAPKAGQTVLDLGCGAGLDMILTARRVGPTGKVVGVDMTEAMIAKARRNVVLCGLGNIDVRQGQIENIPLDDASIDLVISNGVFNLSPNKSKVLAEAFRVLRAGGRLQMADILLEPHVTPEQVATKGAWSD
jgi:SAM-dependent methyltransferase